MNTRKAETSNLIFENTQYKLDILEKRYLDFFRNETTLAFEWKPSESLIHLYGFHNNGIGIYMQSIFSGIAKFLRFIDIRLISDVKPLGELEKMLKDISKAYTRKDYDVDS